jgi:hypothetical protein
MSLSLLSRYAFFAVCVIFTLASLPFLEHDWLWPITAVTGVLSLVGLFDLLQSPHAVRRNYPILGNIRYLVEGLRPEIRQYLLESDSDALPFSRAQRSLVYSRAKNESADKPFGTLIDVYQSGFEFIGHSMRLAPLSDPNSFRVMVGGPQCTQPYSASVFNISAMSFGSLSANAIRALNQGAKLGDQRNIHTSRSRNTTNRQIKNPKNRLNNEYDATVTSPFNRHTSAKRPTAKLNTPMKPTKIRYLSTDTLASNV